MAIVCLIVFILAIRAAVKAGKRSSRRAAWDAPPVPAKQAPPRLAVLDALQNQRDELQNQLEIIDAALDNAPPEKDRLKWLKERTRVYGQLATVESKIQKAIS